MMLISREGRPVGISERQIRFFKILLRSFKRIDERTAAKKDLKKQLERIKKLEILKAKKKTLSKKDKDALGDAIIQLETKIGSALEKEGSTIKHVFEEKPVNSELELKIEKLEKKLDQYINVKDERQRRIQELEDKVKESIVREQELIDVEKKNKELAETNKRISSRLDQLELQLAASKDKMLLPKVKEIEQRLIDERMKYNTLSPKIRELEEKLEIERQKQGSLPQKFLELEEKLKLTKQDKESKISSRLDLIESKLKEEEDKITKNAVGLALKKEIGETKELLHAFEAKYNEMSKEGMDKERLKTIKDKIEQLKNKIVDLS